MTVVSASPYPFAGTKCMRRKKTKNANFKISEKNTMNFNSSTSNSPLYNILRSDSLNGKIIALSSLH